MDSSREGPKLGVLLDCDTIDAGGDIDFSALEGMFPAWRAYDHTASGEVIERIRGANVVISNKRQRCRLRGYVRKLTPRRIRR